MKRNEGRFGLGIVVGLVLLMSMFSLRVIPTQAEAAIVPQWAAATPLNDTHSQAVVVQDEDGLVYIIGGVNTLSYVAIANVSSYDMETGAWTDLAPLPQATRGAAGAYYDGKIYVISGFAGVGYLTNNQVYDIATDTWSSMAPIPVGAWESRAAASDDGRIFVFGGESGPMYWSNAVYVYDIVDDSWSSGSNMPVGVKSGVVVSTGYTFYYLGGEVSGGTTTAAVNVYSWGSWDSAAPMPQAKATFAAVEGADGFIYAFGGGIGAENVAAAYNTSYCYDRWNDVWYDGPYMNFHSRNLGGAASEDGWIFAIGGNDNAAMHTEVDSMQIMSSAASIDPGTVATGRPVLVTVTADFAFAEPDYYSTDAELVSGTGVSYGSEYFQGTMGTTFALSFDVPEGIPAGAYTIVLRGVYIGFDPSGESYLPELRLPLVVMVGDTLDEQMESLQNEIANLQAQLALNQENTTALVAQMTVLLTALSAMQEQVDSLEKKADSANMYGMISMILVIVVIVLLALMLMMARKKP